MQFCPRCGATLSEDQSFCTACGFDLRGQALAEQALGQQTTRMHGLGRNAAVYLTQAGLVGARISPGILLALAFLLPLPLLAAVFIMTNQGALAVYATIWFVSSGLLYDELKWRGLRRQVGRSPEELQAKNSWLVPWGSIRMADWNGRTLWFSSEGPSRKGSVTFNREDAPLVEGVLTSWGVRLGQKRRLLPRQVEGFWTLVILFFIASQTILILAATLPFFSGERQLYTTVLNNTRSQVVGASFLGQFRVIYFNNLQVGWGSTIPYLGVLTFGVASYNTGRVIQVIGLLYHTQPLLIVLSLFLYPHSWIEELSYPITTIAGILAVTRWKSFSGGIQTKAEPRIDKAGPRSGRCGAVALCCRVLRSLRTTSGWGRLPPLGSDRRRVLPARDEEIEAKTGGISSGSDWQQGIPRNSGIRYIIEDSA